MSTGGGNNGGTGAAAPGSNLRQISPVLSKEQESLAYLECKALVRDLAGGQGSAATGRGISAMQCPIPPFSTVIIYNQSRHASNSVLADIRAVWGDLVHVIQTVEDSTDNPTDSSSVSSSVANNRLPGVNGVIRIKPGNWGNLEHFKERMIYHETQNPWFYHSRQKKDVVFMAGWSWLAEWADTGRFVRDQLGLVWPGTDPDVSDKLEKIELKKICKQVGAPTPWFSILSEQTFKWNLGDSSEKEKLITQFAQKVLDMRTTVPGLVKSIHGGGGKGSAHVMNPCDPGQVKGAVWQVLNEMKRADGLYFETKVNSDGDGRFFQLELELDGETVANGGRFVWFNKRLQKVVEIGLSDQYLKDLSDNHDQQAKGQDGRTQSLIEEELGTSTQKRGSQASVGHDQGQVDFTNEDDEDENDDPTRQLELPYFMPFDLYQKARKWASEVAKVAGNNTRATLEALVWKNKKTQGYEMAFIECNRRPQVENEALALLERDSSNNRRYTFAELMMRAKGYPGKNIFSATKRRHVALHARWLHGDPDADGFITYKPGEVVGMQGTQFAFVRSELMPAGEISFTSDPQLGKAVMLAENWHQMCRNAVKYFRMRRPLVLVSGTNDWQASESIYAECLRRLFANEDFRAGRIASNETFSAIDIPGASRVSCASSVRKMLEGPVADVMVNGYRFGEGIDAENYPSVKVLEQVEILAEHLTRHMPETTAYTKFSRGEISHEAYIQALRQQLEKQGGGWVTVAPRDVCQQGMDSESAAIQDLSRKNAEIFAQKAGCVGYETGGAQYQAGLIRGFNPAIILKLGLPFNLPAHSLQRSQYVNGLSELPSSNRRKLFAANADLVLEHYRGKCPVNLNQSSSKKWFLPPSTPQAVGSSQAADPGSPTNRLISFKKQNSALENSLRNATTSRPQFAWSEFIQSDANKNNDTLVPWFPYNFHAGNYYEDDTNYSKQDETTGELLDSGLSPLPTWVFSPKFTLKQLKRWTERQIALFQSKNRKLHQIRIKNPGQGLDWTCENVWNHVQTIRDAFKATQHLGQNSEPIIYIHNHDFNGLGAHVARDLFLEAKRNNFPFLIIDAAYRKNGTHNDNTLVTSALNLDQQQLDNLNQYNHNQQLIESLLIRFDSRASQMTPWYSDWAGGTEGSDLRIAKEYGLSPAQIQTAKEIWSEVFPLERAVTPFSEYKLRLGIAIMIEPQINPKTVDQTYAYIRQQKGKLKVGGDVLIGLEKWETLSPKPPIVDQLLQNMVEDLEAAKQTMTNPVRPHYDWQGCEQLFTELGFAQKGKDLYSGKMRDLSPLLCVK